MLFSRLLNSLVLFFFSGSAFISGQIQDWERCWSERLTEYGQYSTIIKRLLAYRHTKHLQYELIQDALEQKRASLVKLEKAEAEAERLDAALHKGYMTPPPPSSDSHLPVSGLTQASTARAGTPSSFESSTVAIPSDMDIPSDRQGFGPARVINQAANTIERNTSANPLNLWGSFSHILHDLVDIDPDTTRRAKISKARHAIDTVCLVVFCLFAFRKAKDRG